MVSMKSLFTVGGFTFLSRILGLLRDQMIAAFVGAGAVADAFVLAFRLPNMFRRIFAEGAFSTAFVPVYNRVRQEQGDPEALNFARQALGALLVVMVPLCALIIWGMPAVIALMAPGFSDDAAKVAMAVDFGRIMFGYLVAMAVLALFSGVLQSHDRFSAAAAAPTMLNVVIIAALVGVLPFTGMPGYLLSWSVALAGVLQVAVVVWGLRRQGLQVMSPRFGWSRDLAKLAVLMGPGIISAGVWQINTLAHSIIASAQDGALAYLYYADRLYQLPLGLIGVAFGVVLLPSLSRALREGREAEAEVSLNRGIEFALLLTLPAAFALVAIPQALCVGLFEWGAFTRADSNATAWALLMLGLGVPPSVLTKVFMPCFFAREDTKTPMQHAILAVVVSVALGLILFQYIGYVGLALAISLSMWVMAAFQGATLLTRGYWRPDTRLRSRVWRSAVAALLMALVLLAAKLALATWLYDAGRLQALAAMGLLVLLGVATYALAALGLRATSLAELKAAFRR